MNGTGVGFSTDGCDCTSRVLILTNSGGQGLIRTAQAIASALHAHLPRVDTQIVDAADLCLPERLLLREIYDWFLRASPVASQLYIRIGCALGFHRNPFRTVWLVPRLTALIETERPSAIVLVSPWIGEALGVALTRQKRPVPVVTVVGDLGSALPPGWKNPATGRYLAPTEAAAVGLIRLGCHRDRIVVTGFNVDPSLPQAAHRKSRVRANDHRGHPPQNTDAYRIAVLGGACGQDHLAPLVRQLTAISGPSLTVDVYCGRNERLKRRVCALGANPRNGTTVRGHGYVPSLAPAISGADIVITKPGAMTVAECMVLGTPCILYPSSLMLWETGNAAFMVGAGCALQAGSVDHAADLVQTLATDPDRAGKLRRAVRKWKGSAGADRTAAAILDSIKHHPGGGG